MKWIVAGTRGFRSKSKDPQVRKAFNERFNRELFLTLDAYVAEHKIHQPTLIIQGEASGGDYAGKLYANYYGIPDHEEPADWDKHGKSAGHIRNAAMGKMLDPKKDCLIVLWDMKSSGTKGMIAIAKKSKIKTYTINCKELFEKFRRLAEDV